MKLFELPTVFLIAVLCFSLFFLGVFFLVTNTKRGNLLIILMYIEIVLLACNLSFIVMSTALDDLIGQIYSLVILTVAAAESAIGLAIVISLYQLTGSVSFEQIILLRG